MLGQMQHRPACFLRESYERLAHIDQFFPELDEATHAAPQAPQQRSPDNSWQTYESDEGRI